MTKAPPATTSASTVTPVVGSARRATPMGKSGDSAIAPVNARKGSAPADDQCLWQVHQCTLPVGEAKRVEDVLFRTEGPQLTRDDDADNDCSGDGESGTEDPDRDDENVDRVAWALALDREALRTEPLLASEDTPHRPYRIGGPVRCRTDSNHPRKGPDLVRVRAIKPRRQDHNATGGAAITEIERPTDNPHDVQCQSRPVRRTVREDTSEEVADLSSRIAHRDESAPNMQLQPRRQGFANVYFV